MPTETIYPQSRFKAVIFDLFGTLIDDFASSGGARHVEQMAAALQVPYEPFMQLWSQTLEMRIVGEFQTVEANLSYVCGKLNVRPGAAEIAQAVDIRMRHMRRVLQPTPGAIDTLAQLRQRQFAIGLISNASIEIPLLWRETAFADLVDHPVFSSRARLRKPDVRIYRLACERLRVKPEECLYLGDGEDYELTGAAKTGFYPVLVRKPREKTSGKAHEEAREWQGPSIATLADVLDLVENKQ
jgi:putative hydrolase of the HAD superfamily